MQQETTEVEIPPSPCGHCGSIRWSLTHEFKATMLGSWARVTATCGKCAASSTTQQNILNPLGRLWYAFKGAATGTGRAKSDESCEHRNRPESVITLAREAR